MPKQDTKHEAAEAGLVGVAITLLTTGANLIQTQRVAGGALLAAGVLTLFGAIRLRNMTATPTSSEILAGIADAAEQARMVLEAATDRRGAPGGDGGDSE